MKNLREAVERLLGRHAAEIREAARADAPTTPAEAADPNGPSPDAPAVPSPERTQPPSAREQARQAKCAARQERYRRTRELRGQGLSIRQIAKQLGMSFKAVLRYLRQDTCPDWRPGQRRPTSLDAHAQFIGRWIAGGGRNAAELYRLLQAQGCRSSYDAVRRYLNRKIGSTGRPGRRSEPTQPPADPLPSPRKLSFQFIARPRDPKSPGEAAGTPSILDRLRERVPGLKAGLDLAAELAGMLRQAVALPLAEWLAQAEASGIADLANFAASLRADEAAVATAIEEPWSNGQVEGQVNRLKLIKRTMYGRAGMPLLRARVRQNG